MPGGRVSAGPGVRRNVRRSTRHLLGRPDRRVAPGAMRAPGARIWAVVGECAWLRHRPPAPKAAQLAVIAQGQGPRAPAGPGRFGVLGLRRRRVEAAASWRVDLAGAGTVGRWVAAVHRHQPVWRRNDARFMPARGLRPGPQWHKTPALAGASWSAPDRIRTCDLRFRRPTVAGRPPELRSGQGARQLRDSPT